MPTLVLLRGAKVLGRLDGRVTGTDITRLIGPHVGRGAEQDVAGRARALHKPPLIADGTTAGTWPSSSLACDSGRAPAGSGLAESRGRTVLQQPDQEEDDHDHEQRSRTDVHVVSFLLSQPSHQSRSTAAATIATIAQMTSATPPSSTNGVPEPRPRTTDSSVVSGGDEASDTTSSAATSSVGGVSSLGAMAR